MDSEEIISALTELKEIMQASNKQLNSRIGDMENRMAELSGSVAVVLNRSAENKKETAEHKKKLETWGNTVKSLIEEQRFLKKVRSTLSQKQKPVSYAKNEK